MNDAVVTVIQGVVFRSGRPWLQLRTNVKLTPAVLDLVARVISESELFDTLNVRQTRDGIWAYPEKGVVWLEAEDVAVTVLLDYIFANRREIETGFIFSKRYLPRLPFIQRSIEVAVTILSDYIFANRKENKTVFIFRARRFPFIQRSMKTCKRCHGSGFLFRPKPKLSRSQKFKKCSDCGGHGTRPPPTQPRYINVKGKKT